jgi:hypothetical protein
LLKKPTSSSSTLAAALEFVDWTLSDVAMRLYAADYPVTAISTDLQPPIGYISSPLKQILPNNLVWASANYERITGQWLNVYESRTESGGINPLIETPPGCAPHAMTDEHSQNCLSHLCCRTPYWLFAAPAR